VIIQIRGNNGSGKSTTVQGIIARYGLHQKVYARELDNWPEMAEKEDEVLGLILKGPGDGTFVLGNYDRPSGGTDGIKRQEQITQRILTFHNLGYHVVYEGILASTIYQRFADIADKVGRDKAVFCFMDTPPEQCLANIDKRRQTSTISRGPYNVDLFNKKVKVMARCRDKFQAAGYRCVDLHFKGIPYAQVIELLEKG
jgi:thymidylate kinase